MKKVEHPDEGRDKAIAAIYEKIDRSFEYMSLDLSANITNTEWLEDNLDMATVMVSSDPEYAKWLFNSLEVAWRQREQSGGPSDTLVSDVVNHPLAPREVKVDYLDALAGRWRGRTRDNVRSVVHAGAYGLGRRK